MKLNELPSINTRSAKRLGRGLASGKGKTAGRGTKGQKSRSGYNIPRRFEGGQTSLIQKLPKTRGFNSRFDKPIAIRLDRIEAKFNDGETVNLKTLVTKGFLKNTDDKVKIIGADKFTKKLIFSGVSLTRKLAAIYNEVKVEKPAVKPLDSPRDKEKAVEKPKKVAKAKTAVEKKPAAKPKKSQIKKQI